MSVGKLSALKSERIAYERENAKGKSCVTCENYKHKENSITGYCSAMRIVITEWKKGKESCKFYKKKTKWNAIK